MANLGIGLVHDATYVTGISKQGGLITGAAHMVSQLADSKAAHRAGDWMMGNDAKVQHELVVKGIRPNPLTAVDENHDGKVSAQETRDYLIKHHVAAEHVNSLPANKLADTLVSVVAPAPHAAHAPAHPPAHQPPIPFAPNSHMSPEMQRALGAALNCGLSTSIRCDTQHNGPLQVPTGLQHAAQRAVASAGR